MPGFALLSLLLESNYLADVDNRYHKWLAQFDFHYKFDVAFLNLGFSLQVSTNEIDPTRFTLHYKCDNIRLVSTSFHKCDAFNKYSQNKTILYEFHR